MGHRGVLSLAIVLVSTTIWLHSRIEIVRRVHEPSVCWDPDVESPVACDEDDD